MAETWNKRQRELKKKNAKAAKMEKRQERKEHNSKGKELTEMFAYVDEFGNLTETPPEKRSNPLSRIPPDVRNVGDTEKERRGTVIFYDDNKGFGFIKNAQANESVFVHANSSSVELEKNLKVIYEVQKGPKGLTAVNVKADR